MRWPWQRETRVEAPDVEQIVADAVQRATAETVRALLASSPLNGPEVPSARPPLYAFDNPIFWSTPHAPKRRPGQVITVETLRRLADTYDVLRACLQHLKREVASVPLEVVPRDDGDKSEATKRRAAEALEWLEVDGGLGGEGVDRATFEGMLLEDLLVVGAGAAFYRPTRGGGIYEIVAIDAATIRPRVDAFGWPGPGEAAYEQWIQGLKVAEFTRDELTYRGLAIHARSYTPYPASLVEWLVQVVNAALRADQWNLAWLTDGNTPSDMIALPDGWNPQQIREWAEWWDALLAGDSKGRQKTKWVPSGSQRVGSPSRKDQDFSGFELWLLRRTCSITGVQPASIGYVGEQYKVTQEGSMDATSAFGVGVLLDWRKAFYDDLLRRLGYRELEARNVTSREEKAAERADRNVRLTGSGIKTINEARQDEGLDPIEGGDVPLVPGTLRPLEQVLTPPEPPPGDGPPGDGGDRSDSEGEPAGEAARRALSLWERKALNRLKAGKSAACGFESEDLSPPFVAAVRRALTACRTADEVRELFALLRYPGQPRNPDGTFAEGLMAKDESGGGGGSSGSLGQDGERVRLPGREPMAAKDAAQKIVDLHNQSIDPATGEGGSTFSLYEGDLLGRDLWSVSLYPDLGLKIAPGALTPERVAAFVDAHGEILADPRCAVGTWLKNGVVYLDITALTTNENQAKDRGKQYNQQGVYHLGGKGYHDTGGTGDAPIGIPAVDQRLKGIKSWL